MLCIIVLFPLPYIFLLLLYDLLLVHVYVREVVQVEGYIAVELSHLYMFSIKSIVYGI